MKVVITRRFRDADTGQIMYVGNVSDYDSDRAHKLERSGFVKVVGNEKAEDDGSEESELEKPDGELHEKKDEQSFPKRRGRKPKR